ncbi:unnamed protein product, partial [Rotaria socialis]
MSIFVFGICLSCCVGLKRQQQQRTPHIRVPPSHRIIHPYEQQSSPAVHIRSVYATHNAPLSSRMPVMHEEQPPSYEAAVANLSSKYHTEPSPLLSLPECFLIAISNEDIPLLKLQTNSVQNDLRSGYTRIQRNLIKSHNASSEIDRKYPNEADRDSLPTQTDTI